jgi:hypothetical protein
MRYSKWVKDAGGSIRSTKRISTTTDVQCFDPKDDPSTLNESYDDDDEKEVISLRLLKISNRPQVCLSFVLVVR